MCFIKVHIVREYLGRFFGDLRMKFEWNLERLIDDWVLLCFFVGNDFLPHLPGISIRKGGIDILMNYYRQKLPQLPDYLTKSGKINLANLEMYRSYGSLTSRFLEDLKYVELPLLKHIQTNDMGYSQRMQQNEMDKLRRQDMEAQAIIRSLDVVAKEKAYDFGALQPKHGATQQAPDSNVQLGKRGQMDHGLNSEGGPTEKEASTGQTPSEAKPVKTQLSEVDFAKVETVFKQEIYKRNKQKEIKNELYTSDTFAVNARNYKRDYYLKKFGVSGAEYQPFVNSIKLYYIEGIIWNYTYYYKGCVSWDWFFPYYYAPLLSDLRNFSRESFDFEMGAPFNPCEQLLSVLPPFSSHALPRCLQPLLHQDDSELIDLYPLDFFVGRFTSNGRY